MESFISYLYVTEGVKHLTPSLTEEARSTAPAGGCRSIIHSRGPRRRCKFCFGFQSIRLCPAAHPRRRSSMGTFRREKRPSNATSFTQSTICSASSAYYLQNCHLSLLIRPWVGPVSVSGHHWPHALVKDKGMWDENILRNIPNAGQPSWYRRLISFST